MKATEQARRLNHANGQVLGDSQRMASAWIMGNSVTIALVLGLFALWFATSGFSWPGNVWQLAMVIPTTLVVLLIITLIEKSRIRNTEALQLKLDQLIRAAEAVQNSILDLEKISKTESIRPGTHYTDWSPQGQEERKTSASNHSHQDGNHSRHRSGAVNSVNHGAGAHRIRPTGKA
jgi:low affinity Fe/Cu permease